MKFICTLFLGVALTGCVSVSETEQFSQVVSNTEEDTGYSIQWIETDFRDAPTRADSLSSLSLDAAVQMALTRNSEVQHLLRNFGVQIARLNLETGLDNPHLGGDLLFPFADDGFKELGLDLGTQLLQLLTIGKRREMSAAGALLEQQRLTDQILHFVDEIQESYLDVYFSRKSIPLLRQISKLRETAFSTGQKMLEAGNIQNLELANIQANHLKMLQKEEEAVFRLWQFEEKLKNFVQFDSKIELEDSSLDSL